LDFFIQDFAFSMSCELVLLGLGSSYFALQDTKKHRKTAIIDKYLSKKWGVKITRYFF
jgi:hypothetical protein